MRKVFNFLALLAIISCNDSSSDPATNDQSEFNPPGNLQSLTKDGKVILTWVGANAEDDFKGYHVFGVKGTIDDLKSKVSFPDGASAKLASGASVPRCKDNTSFFEAFGFPASDSTCESSVAEAAAEAAADAASFHSEGSTLSSGLLADEDLAIDFNLECTRSGQKVEDGSLSIASADGKQLGRVYCDIEKVYDASADDNRAALVNGQTYVFFVVAVAGSKNNEISWVSNVIEDTPAHALYSSSFELSEDKYRAFTITPGTFTAITPTDERTCGGTENGDDKSTDTGICTLNATADNDTATTTSPNNIYIARDVGSSTYTQRVFVSTQKDTNIGILPRGNRTWAEDSTTHAGEPGDEALIDSANTIYSAAGSVFPVYGKQVFDIRVPTTSGSTSSFYYGKVVVTDLSYADNSRTGKATIAVSVILQPTANSASYLK